METNAILFVVPIVCLTIVCLALLSIIRGLSHRGNGEPEVRSEKYPKKFEPKKKEIQEDLVEIEI